MGAKGQPKASDNCMAASEKPEEMRSREIGRTLVNKGNWNYLQGWNKDESHFPCVWLPWWPAHLGHIPFHLVTFYRQPAACILKISITSELLFLQQQSQEFPDASLLHAHLMWVCLETAGSSLCCVFKGWARPECSELHKPPCQGRLKEWQRRRNLAPEPRSLLCLDLMSGCGRTILAILCLNALISHVWITSFTSLRTEMLSTTAARSLCIQPWAAASPTRKEGAEQPHHLLHGRGRLKKACPILTGSYTYLHHTYGSLSTNTDTRTETWRKGSSERKLGPALPMDSQNLAVTAGDAGYHRASLLGESTEGIGTGRPARSSLRAQYMFFYCSKHVLPLVSTEKKKKEQTYFRWANPCFCSHKRPGEGHKSAM